MADLQSKVTKAQWRTMTEKLREICHHLRHCRECGETDVLNCPEGRTLWLDQFFEDGRSQSDASAEPTFCRSCGASIPHRIGEGRCPDCMHHLPVDASDPDQPAPNSQVAVKP